MNQLQLTEGHPKKPLIQRWHLEEDVVGSTKRGKISVVRLVLVLNEQFFFDNEQLEPFYRILLAFLHEKGFVVRSGSYGTMPEYRSASEKIYGICAILEATSDQISSELHLFLAPSTGKEIQ